MLFRLEGTVYLLLILYQEDILLIIGYFIGYV